MEKTKLAKEFGINATQMVALYAVKSHVYNWPPFAHQIGRKQTIAALVRRGYLESIGGTMQYRLTDSGKIVAARLP